MPILQSRVGWNHRVCILALVIALASVCAFGLIRERLVNTQPRAVAATSNGFQEIKPANLLSAEHLTLYPTGFEPSEITRPAGRFLLAVDNRAGVGELAFVLIREDGLLATNSLVENKKFRVRRVVDLLPGSYSLKVVDHPDWVCGIKVMAP